MAMSMLFKWLFTVLAFWWLYHALRPWLAPTRGSAPPPPPPRTDLSGKKPDQDDEYIDYEEVKEE